MQVNGVVSAILVGIVVGVLGRLALPGRQRIGAFVTLIIGIGSALLGTLVANAFGVADRAPAELWGLTWDWIVLAIQVGFAAVATALAAALTHTRIAHQERPRKRTRSSR